MSETFKEGAPRALYGIMGGDDYDNGSEPAPSSLRLRGVARCARGVTHAQGYWSREVPGIGAPFLLCIADRFELRSWSIVELDWNRTGGPTLPLSDVRPSINTVTLSLTHTFRLGNRTANWAIALPYLGGRISATAAGQSETLSRVGFADFRARLA